MPILRVKVGPQKGKVFDVRGDSQVLSRDSVAEIQILDQGASRKHAEVFRIGEMYFIRDLQSRNHTFVNQKEISEEILKFGDQITIGNTVLVIEDRMRDSKRIVREGEAGLTAAPSSTIVLKIKTELPGPRDPSQQTVEERNLEVLLHLSHIVAEEKNLSRLFGRVAELLGASLAADHLYLLGVAPAPGDDGERGDFEILGRYDRDDSPDEEAGVSRGIINDCLKHNRSVITADASLDQQFNAMASVVMKQIRSVICVPVSVLQKNIGVIYIYSNRSEAFSSEDLELCSAIGIHLGSTIELLKMVQRSDQFFRNSIRTLVSAIEMRTPSDRGKSERVATYCLAIAKELGRGTQEVRDAWLSGMLHDIGSIPMNDQERGNRLTLETKKNHYARELLRGNKGVEHILPAIEQQNERHDGSGSPEGIKGDAVCPLGRILTLALELDNLLYTGGPDGSELSVKETLLKVKELADRQFDRQVVNALLIAYRSGKLFNQSEEFFEVPIN
ncbi:MAG: FHA domain-containing protein [Planctomycetota bacterium]|nr:FHA domain-containing protein [Planctomycetota bacterium]